MTPRLPWARSGPPQGRRDALAGRGPPDAQHQRGHDGAIRREADLIELSVGRGRFRRRRSSTSPPTPSGSSLRAVERAKHGDEDALRFLYLRYADNVYGYVCSIVRDEHEAEDVTQQMFAKLLGSLGATSRAPCRSRPGSCASPTTRRSTTCAPAAPLPVEEVALARRRPTTARPRARSATCGWRSTALPTEQREVIVLRFLVGLSPREIAERIGRTEDAVHGLQHRGRRRCAAS